jgi:phage baseplate assembly protein W
MSDIGVTLSFPFRVDARGSLAVARTAEQIAAEAIADLLETRPGERVYVPDYGVRDFLFSTVNAAFKMRLEKRLRKQILDFVPSVQDADVTVNVSDASRVDITVTYTLNTGQTHSYYYPLWQLIQNS